MYRDKEIIKEKLKKFFDSMIEEALLDEVISDDEQKILDIIKSGIENLETQLIQILESELEIEEFNDLQSQILQDIVHKATQIAKEDDIITPEESRLLERLVQFAKKGVMLDE